MIDREHHDISIHVMASGSKGNAAVICTQKSALIVDAGISCRRITKALQSLRIPMSMVEGILVTHEHSDHIAGLAQMVKQWGLPIITRPHTARVIGDKLHMPSSCFTHCDDKEFVVGDLVVQPFSTSHDAIDPIGITCHKGQEKASFITDTGVITETMMEHLHDSNLLVLEANYDEHMLKFGPYPPDLKRRVGGTHGHLCNDMAMSVLKALRRPKGMEVIFAHRSEHNNALPIVDVMAEKLKARLEERGETSFHIAHGDPKEIISIG